MFFIYALYDMSNSLRWMYFGGVADFHRLNSAALKTSYNRCYS